MKASNPTSDTEGDIWPINGGAFMMDASLKPYAPCGSHPEGGVIDVQADGSPTCTQLLREAGVKRIASGHFYRVKIQSLPGDTRAFRPVSAKIRRL